MRIWDLDPGFLNDKSLLGEHRELHGLFSIHANGKKGYSRHPETVRWKDSLSGLWIRHGLLVAEMQLRGFNHKSPLEANTPMPEGLYPGNAPPDHKDSRQAADWPDRFIDDPDAQFLLLKEKYRDKPQGRIPLPQNISGLWASHKYSVMARDPELYRALGPKVAKTEVPFSALSDTLVGELRKPPAPGRLLNALDHMWGYVSELSSLSRRDLEPAALLGEIRRQAEAGNVTYLLHSTALGELGLWVQP